MRPIYRGWEHPERTGIRPIRSWPDQYRTRYALKASAEGDKDIRTWSSLLKCAGLGTKTKVATAPHEATDDPAAKGSVVSK
jgi:hypothetical protein